MTSSDRRRIALEPTVSADDVDSASWDLDWDFLGTHEASDDGFKEDYYGVREDEGTRVYLVHDTLLKLRYLTIAGPGAAAAASAAKQHLATVDTAEAKRRYEQATTSEDKVAALYLRAIAGPEGEIPQIYRDALKADEVNTRKGAVIGLGYIGGVKAKELLEDIAQSDASEEIREDAASMSRLMPQSS